MATLLESIQTNLNEVLNYRCVHDALPDSLASLKTSLLYYGLPDLSRFNPNSSDDQQRVCELIKNCIHRFEPRLQQVEVNPLRNPITDVVNTMRLMIRGHVATSTQSSDASVLFVSVVSPNTDRVQLESY